MKSQGVTLSWLYTAPLGHSSLMQNGPYLSQHHAESGENNKAVLLDEFSLLLNDFSPLPDDFSLLLGHFSVLFCHFAGLFCRFSLLLCGFARLFHLFSRLGNKNNKDRSRFAVRIHLPAKQLLGKKSKKQNHCPPRTNRTALTPLRKAARELP
ncbi:MAG: hypothetical protein Q3M24_19760 [Candidatus Electrothrix aestuarii]|uniref:Uncharacterized protein n=1 Tax=Candidatus Electrothrix aestuarii TaxID=3062594 RepID=A0AAU8LT76_9BACT|nr:hypothetical protein [Candidatus Electrothrix aestuarii]